ncbi:DUF3325 family protein [Shewanella sp. 202IG2-18]|uniref:DUF3325 family protein n=1 Tax=Parashewanella hymeniacidonis TaxID=2807618 RepID=UPI001960C577|nr:DUF3325 family protein [Parashewanella hymeniacidonis]MBM7071396.1 DUF3325 family protein [Parashewanella hymeniacidonis]
MLMINLLSFVAILCFVFSQTKHFNTVFHKRLSDKQSLMFKWLGFALLFATQPLIIQQSNVGMAYVVWLCWISVWILISGTALSYLAKR